MTCCVIRKHDVSKTPCFYSQYAVTFAHLKILSSRMKEKQSTIIFAHFHHYKSSVIRFLSLRPCRLLGVIAFCVLSGHLLVSITTKKRNVDSLSPQVNSTTTKLAYKTFS